MALIDHQHLDLHFSPVDCGVGEWDLRLPASHPAAPYLAAPGSGIIVSYRGEIIFSGPMVTAEIQADANANSIYEFTGVCDHVILQDALAFPSPLDGVEAQTNDKWKPPANIPFGIIWRAVNANIGPSATEARKNTRLRMEPATAQTSWASGSTTEYSARFESLLTVGAAMHERGAHWRLDQDPTPDDLGGSRLWFREYIPIDTQGAVRFDNRLVGGVASSGATISAPSVTRAIVAGEGHLKFRVTKQYNAEGTVETDWGRRIETFVDQRGTVAETELDEAGAEALKEGSKTGFAQSIELTDDTRYEYGVDYSLGSKVIVIDGDSEIESYVSGIACKVDKDGVRVGIVLGPLEKSEDRIQARVSNLERHSIGGSPWKTLTLTGDWTGLSGQAPEYRVNNGEVVLRGAMQGGALGNAVVLPADIQPLRDEPALVAAGPSGGARVTIDATALHIAIDGYLTGGDSTMVSLSGIRYYIN